MQHEGNWICILTTAKAFVIDTSTEVYLQSNSYEALMDF